MKTIDVGKIIKVTSYRVNVLVSNVECLKHCNNDIGSISFVSVGSFMQTRLPNGELIILRCDEIVEMEDVIIIGSYVGTYDDVIEKYVDGVSNYPLIGENVYTATTSIINEIVSSKNKNIIGTYFYDSKVNVSYNPNILFGKHLGVFGNTGSGKTCTIVSIIQNYIRNNNGDIKFLILDVNGEYRNSFTEDEMDYYEYETLRFNHNILDMSEYGKLFRAAEGIQYPALKACINKLSDFGKKWSISSLNTALDNWVKENVEDNNKYTLNSLYNYLRSMQLRIDTILSDNKLCEIIDDAQSMNTIDKIKSSKKKVAIINLNISDDAMDIVLFLLFKKLYLSKVIEHNFGSHLVVVLEEAHRYINSNFEGTRLGNYFIDKLAREGRKFGLGLVISSQVPSMLSYSIVSQCNSVIMHKITSKKDNEFLRGVLRVSSDIFYEQMNSLVKQHAIVCGEAFKSDVIIRVLDANPLPNSSDPIINELK